MERIGGRIDRCIYAGDGNEESVRSDGNLSGYFRKSLLVEFIGALIQGPGIELGARSDGNQTGENVPKSLGV